MKTPFVIKTPRVLHATFFCVSFTDIHHSKATFLREGKERPFTVDPRQETNRVVRVSQSATAARVRSLRPYLEGLLLIPNEWRS